MHNVRHERSSASLERPTGRSLRRNGESRRYDPGPMSAAFTVLIPTLNEAAGIARVVGVATDAGAAAVLVIDSASGDGTAAAATAAGATVVDATALGDGGPALGKGDSVWRALPLVSTPVTVLLDGDLTIEPSFVRTMVAPVIDGAADFSKADFDRIHPDTGEVYDGRVTAEVAYPLFRTLFPELGQIHEPLSGQVAIRTELIRSLDLDVDYGLEAGMLIDIWQTHGLDRFAHPHCGSLVHAPKANGELGPMAGQVTRAILRRWLDGNPGPVPQVRPANQH